MKENYQTAIADAKTIRELVLLETRNLLEKEIQQSVRKEFANDLLPDDDEELELINDEDEETMDYIHRTAKKYDEEIEDEEEDEYDDELEDDYEEKEETFDLESVVEQLEDDEDEIDAEKLAYMAAQSELRRQKDDDDEVEYEEIYDDDDEENEDDPFMSEERAMDAWRKWNKSRMYKRPFEDMRTVYSGHGQPIKIGNEDRKRLLLHAGLLQPQQLHLYEHGSSVAREMRKKIGIHERDPQYLAKQMLVEWKEDEKQRQLLID